MESCSNCGAEYSGKMKLTSLGFKTFVCAACQTKNIRPFGRGYTIGYWIIAIVSGLAAFNPDSPGINLIFGILAVASIYALIRNQAIKKRQAKA